MKWPFKKKKEGRIEAATVVFPPPRPSTLPTWATPGHTTSHRTPVVIVNAQGMYEAWLTELREYYDKRTPSEWLDPEIGVIRPEWSDCLDDLWDTKSWTSYWLEVAYQCGKMELQVVMRTFAFQIIIEDPGSVYNQKAADATYVRDRGRLPSRVAANAAGGSGGGREARQHFQRLRGFVPSG